VLLHGSHVGQSDADAAEPPTDAANKPAAPVVTPEPQVKAAAQEEREAAAAEAERVARLAAEAAAERERLAAAAVPVVTPAPPADAAPVAKPVPQIKPEAAAQEAREAAAPQVVAQEPPADAAEPADAAATPIVAAEEEASAPEEPTDARRPSLESESIGQEASEAPPTVQEIYEVVKAVEETPSIDKCLSDDERTSVLNNVARALQNSDQYQALLNLFNNIRTMSEKYLLSIGAETPVPTQCQVPTREQRTFFQRVKNFLGLNKQTGGSIPIPIPKKSKKKYITKNDKKSLKFKLSKLIGGTNPPEIIRATEDFNTKLVDLFKEEVINDIHILILVSLYYDVIELLNKYYGAKTEGKSIDVNIITRIEKTKKLLENIFELNNLTPSTSIKGAKANQLASQSTKISLKPVPGNLQPTNQYVGVVILDDFKDLIAKLQINAPSSDSTTAETLVPAQPSAPLQPSVPLQPSSPLQPVSSTTSATPASKSSNPIQVELISTLKQLAKDNFENIITLLTAAKGDLDKQTKEFKALNDEFRKMNAIQSSIADISAKIKVPETQKSDEYVIEVKGPDTPTPTLDEVLSSPLSQKKKEALEKLVAKIPKGAFSLFEKQPDAPATPATPATQSPLLSSPFIKPATPATATAPAASKELTSLIPVAPNSPEATAPVAQGISGLPGATSLVNVPGLPFTFKFTGKKLDLSNHDDVGLLKQEEEIRKLMEGQQQPEFEKYVGSHSRFFALHPLGFYYLGHPMSIKWLTESDKGKEFLGSEAGSKLLPELTALVKYSEINGLYGPKIAEDLSRISREVMTKKIQDDTVTEAARADYYSRMQAYKASLLDKK
jgi:hypothetical protein